jgi:Lrp/AsnC family transcriptional regulator for asnA, asnC and gidA
LGTSNGSGTNMRYKRRSSHGSRVERSEFALDDVDKKILNYLSNHDFQSAEALAQKIGINANTVRRHLRHLKADRVIRVAAVADPSRMGIPLAVLIGIDAVHNRVGEVTEILASMPEIKWLTATTGRYDVMLYAWFKSTEELTDFIQNKLGPIDGIHDTETFVCLPIKGTTTYWLTSKCNSG